MPAGRSIVGHLADAPRRSRRMHCFRLGFACLENHTRSVADPSKIVAVSLEPDPVVEAYKKDVDRTLLRETSSSPWSSAFRR